MLLYEAIRGGKEVGNKILSSESKVAMKSHPKSVRELLAPVVVCLFALTGGAGQSAGQDKPAQPVDFNKLANDYFNPLLASKTVSAAAVVVIDKDKRVFSMAYGSGDLKSSVWRVASVSKALTAMAIMRLVEERRVDLDTDVNRYLKSFQVPATFPQPITLRQLLEHRSGLDDRFVGDGFANGEQPPMQLIMKKFLPARVYPPNEVEFYSNYGYGLIGAVIEDVTGMRFEDYMAASVLKPLGMNRSSFAQPLAADAAAATVPGKWWYQHAAPAGGLATTVEDMTAFLSATMHEDSAVI